jgi:hypothetical protein
VVEHTVQFWSVPASTRRRFLEDTAASGGSKCPGLQGVGLLIALGYASITKQQAAAGWPRIAIGRQILGFFLSKPPFKIDPKGKHNLKDC